MIRTMKKSKKKIELPLVEPIYSTYHRQGFSTAIFIDNPSIKNQHLNEVMILTCNRKFLKGFTTPEVNVSCSSWQSNPYLEKRWYSTEFLEGYSNIVIRRLLDAGYYVCFGGIDDYYIKGKSWYHKRHFLHDGCICGYDQENKTYCIYSYDQNWIFRKFWTAQKSFDAGRKAAIKTGLYPDICGIKPNGDQVEFCPQTSLQTISEYLDSNIDKYPESEDGNVYGIVVHDYIAKYVGKLYDGSIPYEKMDRRVFRMIWEHKKSMLERIRLIEDALLIDHSLSDAYSSVVFEADNCRMLYAAHHMKQRNSVLPIIQKKLMSLKEAEKGILEKLMEASKGEIIK